MDACVSFSFPPYISPRGGAKPTHSINCFRCFRSFMDTQRLLLRSASSSPLAAARPRHRFRLRGELSMVGLLDTFCVNVLDWGSRGVLAIACEDIVQLWRTPREPSPENLPLPEEEEGLVTSVCWAPDGARLALGMGNSEIQLWDVERGVVVWRRPAGIATGGASSIVSALSWKGETVLTSGAMSGAVQNHDIRIRSGADDGASASARASFAGHRAAGVCGLQWSECGSQLASSDESGRILIWDPSTCVGKKPLHRLKKDDGKVPVRALSWCPSRRRLLASAGMGEENPAIAFWNTQTGSCAKSIAADSGVTGLVWSADGEELMSAHGDGKLALWEYSSTAKVAEVRGHNARAMFVARGPDGQLVATASGGEDSEDDGCVRVWGDVFRAPEKSKAPFASFPGLR